MYSIYKKYKISSSSIIWICVVFYLEGNMVWKTDLGPLPLEENSVEQSSKHFMLKNISSAE